jgi:predicted transcriptional regulator
MISIERVVTAKLPRDLISRLDEAAKRVDRHARSACTQRFLRPIQ